MLVEQTNSLALPVEGEPQFHLSLGLLKGSIIKFFTTSVGGVKGGASMSSNVNL